MNRVENSYKKGLEKLEYALLYILYLVQRGGRCFI